MFLFAVKIEPCRTPACATTAAVNLNKAASANAPRDRELRYPLGSTYLHNKAGPKKYCTTFYLD